jgi:hypothetical protein
MAERSAPRIDQGHVHAAIKRLVTAADGDTLYRDVYLRRAVALLSPSFSESDYAAVLVAQQQLEQLLPQARAAVARQDWAHARDLGTRAGELQRSLGAEKELLVAAEAAYGAPAVALDPLSPDLPPSRRWAGAAQARAEVITVLAALAREDPTSRELYAARQHALETLGGSGASEPGVRAATEPTASIEQQALQALERGDVAALQSLADSKLGRTAPAAATGEEGARTIPGRIEAPAVLGEPLPEASLSRASALGLERVDATMASPALAGAIADFIGRYALGASPAAYDRARDGVAHVTQAAKVGVPADLAAIFAETISLFALHLYVNSAGLRYVPLPAPREVLLVESHADGDESVTPLLRELGLDRRRALSRDDIEAQLRKNGARIVGEQLGLDPLAFRIVCIPPDVFVRIGRDRSWGQRPEWTHFDGYQVMKGGRLRALVGGNVRFGGLFDLCSISGDDGRDNTLARFAVIRRERLGVRIA